MPDSLWMGLMALSLPLGMIGLFVLWMQAGKRGGVFKWAFVAIIVALMSLMMYDAAHDVVRLASGDATTRFGGGFGVVLDFLCAWSMGPFMVWAVTVRGVYPPST